MPLQRGEQRPVSAIPQMHIVLSSATGQAPPIRTPDDLKVIDWLRRVHPNPGAGGGIPHLHSAPSAPGGQILSIRAPPDAMEWRVRLIPVPPRLPTSSPGGLPKPTCIC